MTLTFRNLRLLFEQWDWRKFSCEKKKHFPHLYISKTKLKTTEEKKKGKPVKDGVKASISFPLPINNGPLPLAWSSRRKVWQWLCQRTFLSRTHRLHESRGSGWEQTLFLTLDFSSNSTPDVWVIDCTINQPALMDCKYVHACRSPGSPQRAQLMKTGEAYKQQRRRRRWRHINIWVHKHGFSISGCVKRCCVAQAVTELHFQRAGWTTSDLLQSSPPH